MCIHSWNHHTIKIINTTTALKISSGPLGNLSYPFSLTFLIPRRPPISFLPLEISLHILELYINGNIQCVPFFFFLVFHQHNYFGIHSRCCVCQAFIFLCCWIVFYCSLFIHLLVDGQNLVQRLQILECSVPPPMPNASATLAWLGLSTVIELQNTKVGGFHMQVQIFNFT